MLYSGRSRPNAPPIGTMRSIFSLMRGSIFRAAKGPRRPGATDAVGTLDRPHTSRLHGHRSARETSAQGRTHGPTAAPVPPQEIEKAEEPGADDEARSAVFRNDDVGPDVSRLATRLRCGLQDQQQGEPILLDWFQIACGCSRWANPHQLRADFGLAQRYAGSRAAVAADGATRDQPLRSDGCRLRRRPNSRTEREFGPHTHHPSPETRFRKKVCAFHFYVAAPVGCFCLVCYSMDMVNSE